MFTSKITNGLRFTIKNPQSFLHTSNPIKRIEVPNNSINPIESKDKIAYKVFVVLVSIGILDGYLTHNNTNTMRKKIYDVEDRISKLEREINDLRISSRRR